MSLELVPFTEEHLLGVLDLCEAEGWPTLAADPRRATRALTAPGVVSVVALDEGAVVGFAYLLTDGEIDAYLAALAVSERVRRRGIGRALVDEVFARSGAQRLDLLAGEGSEDFYCSYRHRIFPGYRIYPGASPS